MQSQIEGHNDETSSMEGQSSAVTSLEGQNSAMTFADGLKDKHFSSQNNQNIFTFPEGQAHKDDSHSKGHNGLVTFAEGHTSAACTSVDSSSLLSDSRSNSSLGVAPKIDDFVILKPISRGAFGKGKKLLHPEIGSRHILSSRSRSLNSDLTENLIFKKFKWIFFSLNVTMLTLFSLFNSQRYTYLIHFWGIDLR